MYSKTGRSRASLIGQKRKLHALFHSRPSVRDHVFLEGRDARRHGATTCPKDTPCSAYANIQRYFGCSKPNLTASIAACVLLDTFRV